MVYVTTLEQTVESLVLYTFAFSHETVPSQQCDHTNVQCPVCIWATRTVKINDCGGSYNDCYRDIRTCGHVETIPSCV